MMNQRKIKSPLRYWLYGLIFMGFTSCNVAYLPSMQNVPLISRTGEMTCSLSGSKLQGAGALNQNMSMMVNLQYTALGLSAANEDENDIGFFNMPVPQWNLECAPGLYKSLAENIVFEVYGGAGIGGSNVMRYDPEDRYHCNHYRLFIQPDFGVKGEKWEMAISTRFIRLQYFNEKPHGLDTDWLKDHDVFNLDKNAYLFIEPAATIRYKFNEDITAFAQIIYSEKMNPEPLKRMNSTLIVGFFGRF